VQDTLARLKLDAKVLTGDARKPDEWWDENPYDRILLDAPCSGTGVIRRHPDIKWLRRPADIPRMAQVQFDLLENLWPLLAKGGTLVYAVCSILHNEGDAVIAAFRERHPEARPVRIGARWGEATEHGRHIRPGEHFDGFYYARLEKR